MSNSLSLVGAKPTKESNMPEDTPSQAVQKFDPDKRRSLSIFDNVSDFESAQRMANALSQSSMIPDAYRGKVADVLVALDISQRVHVAPLVVMQHLYIVHGKPAWDAQYVIGAIAASGRFSPLRFDEKPGECTAYATDTATGEKVSGTKVTMKMATDEGWVKNSKWRSMPEQMLRYRAATFFGRVFAADVLMGLQTDVEIEDVDAARDVTPKAQVADIPAFVAPKVAEVQTPAEPTGTQQPPVSTVEQRRRGRPKQDAPAPTVEPKVVETTAAPVQQTIADAPASKPSSMYGMDLRSPETKAVATPAVEVKQAPAAAVAAPATAPKPADAKPKFTGF